MRKVQIILSVLFILTLNSCSLEKRYHSSGYNINWHFTTANQERKTSSKLPKPNRVSSVATQTSAVKIDSSGLFNSGGNSKPPALGLLHNSENNQTSNRSEIEFSAPKIAHSVVAINSNNEISIASKLNTNPDLKGTNSGSRQNSTNLLNSIFNKYDKIRRKTDNQNELAAKTNKHEQLENSGNSGSGTRVFGTLLIIMGVVFIIFVSIILGFILMALGLLLRAVAGPKHKPTPVVETPTQEKKVEFVDVVYLKNGSIIRGLIMEQIPNESLKIQTSDGSLFVYKMEEVVKITKEEKK